jgi:hypothetical protein
MLGPTRTAAANTTTSSNGGRSADEGPVDAGLADRELGFEEPGRPAPSVTKPVSTTALGSLMPPVDDAGGSHVVSGRY